jgi:hypothetical protein
MFIAYLIYPAILFINFALQHIQKAYNNTYYVNDQHNVFNGQKLNAHP